MSGRGWESVMVAVPALPHSGNRQPGDIVALNGSVLDEPILMAAPMSNVRDVPVHGEAYGHPNNDAPDYPRPAAKPEQDRSDRYLMEHPRLLQETVKWVIADAGTSIKLRRMIEQQLEV
jgi:hypothetical protein